MDGPRIIVQPGTGYDLLLSACLVSDRTAARRFEAGAIWRRRAETVDGGRLLRSIEAIGREPWINLLGFVHAQTKQPSAANAMTALETADPREVTLAAVGYFRRAMRLVTPPPTIRAAVDGNAAAIAEFVRTSYPDLRHWQSSLRHLLGAPPATVRDHLADVLRRWHADAFSADEPAIARAQDADAAIVRELVAALELDAVLDRVAPGLTFAREIGQSVVVLTPSVVLRPTVALTDYGSTLVIAYPAGGQIGDDAEPPERLVRLAKALGDPLRLRALRELRDGPMSITELAKRLGVPRTSLQHHVRILLDAGVASLSVDDARWGNLELRPDAFADVGRLAERWVLGREGLPPTRVQAVSPESDL